MSDKIHESGTIMLVPFRFNCNNQEKLENARRELISIVCPNSATETNKVINSTHYPDYIKHHLGNGFLDEVNDPYLKFYKLGNNQLKELTSKFYIRTEGEEKQNIYFTIKAVQLLINQNKQLNEIGLGYWLVEFEWEELDATVLLEMLGNTAFFRFHKFNEDLLQKKHMFFNEQDEEFGLNVWLRRSFSEFDFNQIEFYQPKTTLLHLINTQLSQEQNNNFAYRAYCSLRVPPKNWSNHYSDTSNNLLNLKRISIATEIVSLDEGALILQHFINDRKDIFNTYFPAFLIAVNQREVIHYLIQKTTTVFSNKMNNEVGEDYDMQLLKQLKTLLIHVKHFQFFHLISKHSEINSFFQELQSTFLIDLGIKDLQDSIGEMNELIDGNYRKRQEKRAKEQAEELQKQREMQENAQNKLNYLLAGIALLSIFSAFTDAYDLFDIKGKITPHFIWLGFGAIIGTGFYLFKKKDNTHKK